MKKNKLGTSMCLAFLLCVLLTPKEGHGLKAINDVTKNPKHPPPPPAVNLTNTDCEVSLVFFNYEGRVCGIPPDGLSNPANVNGASSLNQNNTFYCKITVEPSVYPGSYNTSTYTTIWTSRSSTIKIKVPNEVVSKVTVLFYERCNNCTNSRSGRPFFRYMSTLGKGQKFLTALMGYLYAANC